MHKLDPKSIEVAALKTFETLEGFYGVLTFEELHTYLVLNNIETPVSEPLLKGVVNKLIQKGTCKTLDGYIVAVSDAALEKSVQRRKDKLARARKDFSKAAKILVPLRLLRFIRFIGIAHPLTNKSSKPKLVIIVKSGYAHAAKMSIQSYLALRAKPKTFVLDTIIEKSSLTREDTGIERALFFITTKPVINKRLSYENFIHKNMWMFNYFKNYPLDKISMNYKVVNIR